MSHVLEFDTDRLPGALVARAGGDIDMASSEPLQLELREGVARHSAQCLVIDLGEVEYIDSSGIELLFRLHAALAADDVELIVVAPPGSNAGRLLGLVAMTDIGEVRGSLPEALDRCGEREPR